ncbi:hypothetical protein MMC18_006497, partial [Xylographa bjoerkii]|nr:hypothetical protein [Xylographa bjoerkii]
MSNPLSTLCVLLFLSILSGRTLGLGINCRGSDLCPHATWNNQASESVIRVLRDAVWDSTLDNSTRYRNGDHIICVSQTQNVTLSGIPYGSAGTTFDLNSNFGIGGICLFPQDCTLTLKQIRPLTNALLAHGCTICGSVPIHFIDEGSNDPGEGILSFNYQANPVCDGNCITGSGQTNASIITSSTISPDAASAAASTTASILPSD